MMKKMFKLLIIACLMVLSFVPVVADTKYVIDNGDFFTSDEEYDINERLETISADQDINYVILTSDENVADIKEAAVTTYETNYGDKDALVLYINLSANEFYLLRYGQNVEDKINQEESGYMINALINASEESSLAMAESFIKNGEFYYVDDGSAKRDPLLVDEADLLTADEEADLTELLERASNHAGVDLVVYTTDYDNGQAENMAAADFYDYHNYAVEGFMLYINMATRRLFILTSGPNTRGAFSDADLDNIIADVGSYLSDGNYYDAVKQFIDGYDSYYSPIEPGFDLSQRDPLVIDKADLLSETDEVRYATALDHMSYDYAADFIVYTTDELTKHHYEDDASDDVLLNGKYRYTAVLMYISTNAENPFVNFSFSGEYRWEFDYDQLEVFENELLELVQAGKTDEAIDRFMNEIFDYYYYDKPATTNEIIRNKVLMISSISGLIVAIIVAISLIAQMRSFGKRSNATDYSVNQGSFYSKANITRSNDIYLYRTTSRVHSPERNNSSSGSSGNGGGGHSSSFSGSSGVSHGGRGGSF